MLPASLVSAALTFAAGPGRMWETFPALRISAERQKEEEEET